MGSDDKCKNIVSCRIAAQLISEKMDHKLPFTKEIKLNAHLAICKTCTLYEKQIHLLKQAFAHYLDIVLKHPPSSSKSLPEPAKKRIIKTLKEQN